VLDEALGRGSLVIAAPVYVIEIPVHQDAERRFSGLQFSAYSPGGLVLLWPHRLKYVKILQSALRAKA